MKCSLNDVGILSGAALEGRPTQGSGVYFVGGLRSFSLPLYATRR